VKLKPIFKQTKPNFLNWVLKNIPDNSEYECFVEPYVSSTNLFLFNKKSKIEVLGDFSKEICLIYKHLRDKPKEFVKTVKKLKYENETFEKCLNSNTQDIFEQAINEFCVHKMSKKENKRSFSKGKDTNWKKSISILPDTIKRIKDCFILDKNPFDLIKAFDDKKTFCFINPPDMDDPKFSDFDSVTMTTDQHIELSQIISDYKGKIMIIGYQSSLYKRLYKEWNCDKRVNDKETNKYKKNECIWRNY